MSIDAVQKKVQAYFNHLSGSCYVRILDTPHIWGESFNDSIMTTARARTKEFERAIAEIIQKSRYRCDVASLNSPDPDWARVILAAMDVALSQETGKKRKTQFRFLFGQTPLYPTDPPPNYTDFQGALVRLVRSRRDHWEEVPEIWMGRFYRVGKGLASALGSKVGGLLSAVSFGLIPEGDDDFTKMTWNHSKIIAVDGAEALVGGHNLNMDLFTSYPPVHDVSVVVHGGAAYGAQQYLNEMWECKTDLLTKEYLDVDKLVWKNVDDDGAKDRSPEDPLAEDENALRHMLDRLKRLAQLHGSGRSEARGLTRTRSLDDLDLTGRRGDLRRVESSTVRKDPVVVDVDVDEARRIRLEDLQTLEDLRVSESVLEESKKYDTYDKLEDYRLATRMLSVGKYWTGPDIEKDYKKASELMKEQLIKGAQRILRLSQMDLVSAWKKKWSSHVVCHWIMDALLKNDKLVVQVVVSPLDAGAGAEGDQYSFGSGACRTFDLIRYYMTHDVATDLVLEGAEARAEALKRLHIAPLYFTDRGTDGLVEGDTYKWPGLDPKGFTATLKQPPLKVQRPEAGIIGDAVEAVIKAGGFKGKVESAPGNHAKIMIVDDESYVVGSDNLYPGFLSEFNYLIEGEAAVREMLESYWHPLWWYSGQHCVNPFCVDGCKAAGPKPGARTKTEPSKGSGPPMLSRSRSWSGPSLGREAESATLSELIKKGSSKRSGISGVDAPVQGPPLFHPANAGRVRRIVVGQPEDLGGILAVDMELAQKGVEARKKEEASKKESLGSPKKESLGSPKKESPSSSKKVLDLESNGDKIEGTHYYTDRQIYRLMDHYIGGLPNVVVLHGINGYQLARLERGAYDGLAPKVPVLGAPLTIVQPYNVRGNHWALLHIKVDPPVDARLTARVLYLDPLNPHEVPNLSPLRRVFDDLSVERCTIRYQNDGELGQHSCGPWIVCLSYCLAAFNDVVPPAEDDPLAAAIELRSMHQQVMNRLGPDYL